jgi:hypothetical protein
MPPLLRRLAIAVLVAATLAGCSGGGAGSDTTSPGQAVPATTPSTAAPTTTGTPATAPTRLRPPPPELGIVAARKRQAAPDLSVTDFDARTVTLGGFRGQPVVVNFFESW